MGRVLGARAIRAIKIFFNLECTIQVDTPTYDDHGQPVSSWSSLAGHVAIPCRRAPVTEQERRALGQVVESATHVVALYGVYTSITPVMRAVVDGTNYDITGVRTDSDGVLTYLGVKTVRI
jgi:hypothetical protein